MNLSAPAEHLAMSTPLPLGVIFLLLVIAVFAYAVIRERRRRERMRQFAAARGLTYVERDDRWLDVDLEYGQGGSSHKIKNVMSGQHNGRPISIFEHTWTTGSADNRDHHAIRVTVIGLPRSFPKLVVSHESTFSSIARRFGVKDIELESEDFNRRYRVVGDRRLAYDVLNPRAMQWMLSSGAPGFVISGPYIAFVVGGQIELDEVDGEIAYLDRVIAHMPTFLLSADDAR